MSDVTDDFEIFILDTSGLSEGVSWEDLPVIPIQTKQIVEVDEKVAILGEN